MKFIFKIVALCILILGICNFVTTSTTEEIILKREFDFNNSFHTTDVLLYIKKGIILWNG